MQQQDQATQPMIESVPLWEAPELIQMDVSSSTLAGGASNADALLTFSS